MFPSAQWAPGFLWGVLYVTENCSKRGIKPELFSLSLVCVKGHYPFMTCHSESVINNVVSYTSAQKQVGLVKPRHPSRFSQRFLLWSKCHCHCTTENKNCLHYWNTAWQLLTLCAFYWISWSIVSCSMIKLLWSCAYFDVISWNYSQTNLTFINNPYRTRNTQQHRFRHKRFSWTLTPASVSVWTGVYALCSYILIKHNLARLLPDNKTRKQKVRE